MLCFFAAKGGAGCSTAAAVVAVLSSRREPTLLVDLQGDQSELLSIRSNHDAGVGDWFRATDAPPDALRRMEVAVSDSLDLLPAGSTRSPARPDRYRTLAAILAGERRRVVVDVGTRAIPAVALVSEATKSVLVTRACYLAIRAAEVGPRPDEVLLIREPRRMYSPADVSALVHAPIGASVPWSQDVSRAVDGGTLLTKVPRCLKPMEALL